MRAPCPNNSNNDRVHAEMQLPVGIAFIMYNIKHNYIQLHVHWDLDIFYEAVVPMWALHFSYLVLSALLTCLFTKYVYFLWDYNSGASFQLCSYVIPAGNILINSWPISLGYIPSNSDFVNTVWQIVKGVCSFDKGGGSTQLSIYSHISRKKNKETAQWQAVRKDAPEWSFHGIYKYLLKDAH